MSQKKYHRLQADIDKTLKKVAEGITSFNQIWDRVHEAKNQNLKEKHEADLKKEIKRLQRYRDQIKSWMGNDHVKDKRLLIENRKHIETKMEEFKICEKETKTKAYSKEALAKAAKRDLLSPEQQVTMEWISKQTESLNDQQKDQKKMLEEVQRNRRRKGNEKREEQLLHRIDRHDWHLQKLQDLASSVQKGHVSPTLIMGTVSEDIEYYVQEAHTNSDWYDDDFLYDNIDSLEVYQEEQEEKEREETPPPTPTPKKKKKKLKDKKKKTKKKVKKAVTSASGGGSSTAYVPASPTPIKSTPVKKPIILSVPSSSSYPGRKNSVEPARSESSVSVVDTPASSVHSLPIERFELASNSSSPSRTLSSIVKRDPVYHSPSSNNSMKEVTDLKSIMEQQASEETKAPPTTLDSKPPSRSATLSSTQPPDPMNLKLHGAKMLSSPTREGYQPNSSKLPLGSVQSKHNFHSSSTSVHRFDSAATKSERATGPPPQSPSLKRIHLRDCGFGSLDRNPNESVLLNDKFRKIYSQISTSSRTIPPPQKLDSRSFEKRQNAHHPYQPQNPQKTPSVFPTEPTQMNTDPDFFSELDVDTLFFIFYFQQGTYQQYLAARQLKRLSWRFHKKFFTWFMRHEEPHCATEHYEEGDYVYFDYDANWCQRVKNRFRFEYSHLEQEIECPKPVSSRPS